MAAFITSESHSDDAFITFRSSNTVHSSSVTFDLSDSDLLRRALDYFWTEMDLSVLSVYHSCLFSSCIRIQQHALLIQRCLSVYPPVTLKRLNHHIATSLYFLGHNSRHKIRTRSPTVTPTGVLIELKVRVTEVFKPVNCKGQRQPCCVYI